MKKHKKSIYKIIRASLFCIGLICIVGWHSKVLERKSDESRLGDFFEENNYDALFLGTSHVRDGIFPMELWNEFGITSYNLSGSTSRIAQDYWVMKNALDYTDPKLIVVDCSGLSSKNKVPPQLGRLHEVIDTFPLSFTKLAMIKDLIDEPNDRTEFIWKFSLYHNRWSELTEADFASGANPKATKGATPYARVAVPQKVTKIERDSKLDYDTVNVEYLCKIIEECQSKNIDVLLTYLPFPASEEKQKEANRAYDIAEEYGVNYVNFLDMDIVNYDIDCADSNSHLNQSGAGKVMNYLGEYIMNHYELTDHRKDENYQSWDEAYETYAEYKINNIKSQTALDRYLMLLSDKNYSYGIYIRENSEIFQDERMLQLIENISGFNKLQQLREAAASGKDYFLFVDNLGKNIEESVDGEKIEYSINDAGENYLDEESDSDIKIVILDKETGEMEDIAEFKVDRQKQKFLSASKK